MGVRVTYTSSASGAERNRRGYEPKCNGESTLSRIVWCLKIKATFRNLRHDRNEEIITPVNAKV